MATSFNGAGAATGRTIGRDGSDRRACCPFVAGPAEHRVHLSGEDELGDILEDDGFIGVRAKSPGTIQWVRAKRGSHCDASLAAFR